MTNDPLTPKTALDRGPLERPIQLDRTEHEFLEDAGGDTEATDLDANVGGASATAGLDSGGAVGVRRGPAVGRPGVGYEASTWGERPGDLVLPLEAPVDAALEAELAEAPGSREFEEEED